MPNSRHDFSKPRDPAEEAMNRYPQAKDGWPPEDSRQWSPEQIAEFRQQWVELNRINPRPLPDRDRRNVVTVGLCFVSFLAGALMMYLQYA